MQMKFNSVIAILLVAFAINTVSAQGPPPPPPPLQIDGGILGLVLAAIGLAVFKIRNSFKK